MLADQQPSPSEAAGHASPAREPTQRGLTTAHVVRTKGFTTRPACPMSCPTIGLMSCDGDRSGGEVLPKSESSGGWRGSSQSFSTRAA